MQRTFNTKESGKVKSDEFNFDINTVPFSRKLSFISISNGNYPTESGESGRQLGIFRLPRKYSVEEQKKSQDFPAVITIRPILDGVSIPYICAAKPSMMEVQTEFGYVQFCFDNKDVIRIKGHNSGLRLYSKMHSNESLISRLDGTYQAIYDMIGEFLFVPIKGEIKVQNEWNWEMAGNENFTIDIAPDSNGEFEFAIHFAESNTERCKPYRPFDECVDAAQKDYEKWYAMYPPVPGKYEEMKKLATYCIWICDVGPMGLLKNNVITYEKTDSAFAWQGAYHAMMINDVDFAVQMMLSIFEYQDDYGQIPDMVDDRYVNYLATKPPCFGAAIIYMFDHIGDRLTKHHCEMLYAPLVKLCNWWTTFRDTDNDGVPQYNQGCEQGSDYSAMFSKGVPVECPDIIAYIILLEEGLAMLAERLGRIEESKEWLRKSKELLDTLLEEFWDGEKFIARLSSSHEIIDFEEIDAYSPIILGSRLPQNVIDKIAETLSDTDKYYTRIGLRKSPKHYYKGILLPGIITGANQIKLVPGLYEAGKKELAANILRGFCDKTLEKLPMYRYLEFDLPENLGTDINILYYIDFGVCSAFSSVLFMILASMLEEISD